VRREARIDQECVEAYVFSGTPPRLLIFRRPPERGRVWVPVSGKVEPSDRNFGAAARRELKEETGFTRLRRFFPLRWTVVFPGPDKRRWRLHAFAAELTSEMTPRLSSEHESFEWVSVKDARRRLSYPDNKLAVGKLEGRLTGSTPRRVTRARARKV
jgi:8-oxo-dGTP pyrophosphatase MutT (NUDIX family)